MHARFFLIAILGVALSVGCGDSTGDADAGSSTDTVNACAPSAQLPTVCPGPDAGCATGFIVDNEGCPVEGIKILACDDDSCITGDTDANGMYLISLSAGWRKMQVMGTKKDFMTILFHTDVVAGSPSSPAKHVQLVPEATESAALVAETGGTAVVAGGALEITAEAEDAEFPIGFDEALSAVAAPVSSLGPYDSAPWAGKEDGTLAFHLGPATVKSKEKGFSFKVTTAVAGTTYAMYYVDGHDATLKDVGQATADDAGVVEGSGVTSLTTLILIPQ